eukprot:scaffold17347_cov116-Isochrysis_galbana.AAC.3
MYSAAPHVPLSFSPSFARPCVPSERARARGGLLAAPAEEFEAHAPAGKPARFARRGGTGCERTHLSTPALARAAALAAAATAFALVRWLTTAFAKWLRIGLSIHRQATRAAVAIGRHRSKKGSAASSTTSRFK